MSLSTKYRPISFAEVIGQRPIISILSRQVATKTWKHVYLFDGCHGCGKTTVARILANEINHGEGEPIEIDAASNNGVDNIRSLIIDAQQSSIDCDYKIYIIDECHQLTKAAWDAALKLIEEPPFGAIFIFCTTNPQKVPKTIMSRVQRFTFKKVSKDEIAGRLAYILNEDFPNIKYETTALNRIAALSDGHVRDAIQHLDKCLSYSVDITLDLVESTLGLASYECIVQAVNAIIDMDVEAFIKVLQLFDASGVSILEVYDDIINYTIDMAIYSKTGNLSCTNISPDVKGTINKNDKFSKLVTRLLEYRKFADQNNASALLKTICIEFSEE